MPDRGGGDPVATMVLGGVLRSVAGWKADKYQFEVTIHSAYNLLPGTKALQVVWKRGTKATSTKAVKAQRGEALWDEDLSLVCTMFVNPKTSTYEPKPAMFQVREILDAPLKERVYAEAVVDLLEFAMQPGRTIKRTLPLAQGKKTLPTHIIFSVKATPLREGVALSEVSSNVSVADLAEVQEADEVDRDEEVLFEQHRNLKQSQETHVTTKSKVITTTTTTAGFIDPETGEFTETGRTREQIVQEAMDSTMTEAQKVAFQAMEEKRAANERLEKGVIALRDSLADPEQQPRSSPQGLDDVDDDSVDLVQLPLANTGRQAGRYVPPVLYDDDVYAKAGFAVGLNERRDPLLDVTSGIGFDGHLGVSGPSRLMVGRVCKINVRAADHFGNSRSVGGDTVEGILTSPTGEDSDDLTVTVTDHGDGTYGLEFSCTSQGVWNLRLKFNGRLSNQKHEMVVSYGPLVASDLQVKSPVGPFLCGGYTDVVVEVKNPELGRVMSGAEAFSVRVISPSAMSMSVPLELESGATTAIATVCWPEVGEHSVSVTLDGALLPKCPMAVNVLPEDICLAACQIQGAGTHRAVAGERASFVVEAHDARGNRLTKGNAPLGVVVRSLADKAGGATTRGQILDYGNGAYEASYTMRIAGPYEVALVLAGEELVMKGSCEPGAAVVTGCVLLGDAVLDLEVGTRGRFAVERRDAYGNRAPSRQGQLALRCAVDGPGNAEVHVVDGADGRSDVVASAEAAGRYFLTVVGGDDQEPVPGSPFELVAYPGAAAANASVTTVYGAQLASPDSDVLTAVAGDEITLTVAPRDAFGNQTVFGPGARVVVSATGGPGGVETKFEDRGGPRAEATTHGVLNAAGSYLLSAKVGDEPLAGYPRILQIVPGATDPRRCVLFGEALGGVNCGKDCSMTMHAADRFGNLRATGGDVVDLSVLAPDGRTVVAASVTDHADGTYGATFKLDHAGTWGLQLIVNGRGGRTDISEITANFGPCKAQDCVFTGFGMDGLEGVTTMSSSRIVISPAAYETAGRRMSGKESIGVRVLTPSGGISAVELQFIRGRYEGSYRWTQPGLHTVSVSLDQEAVVGSPFTVEALAALPEIRELESMSIGDINGILQKLDPNASAQALATLPPNQAAQALAGHAPEAMARMMNGMYPSATAQILAALDMHTAAGAVSAMSEEKAREVLAAMSAEDVGAIASSMSAGDMRGKADVLARTLLDMSDEDAAAALKSTLDSMGQGDNADESGVAAVLEKMPAGKTAEALAGLSAERQAKIFGAMSGDAAAAALEAMPEDARLAALAAMGDAGLRKLTAGLGAAYEDDKNLPAAERARRRAAATARSAALAPSLAKMLPGKLAASLADADAAELAGTLHALLGEPAGEGWKLPGFGDWSFGGKDKSAAAALLRALPKDKQKAAALELLRSCPPGTAGAILADFSGEEIAAMLANASAEEHAKLLAELTKEDPDKAAAFLAALSPEKSGAALSMVVAGANDGTSVLSEAELFALFGKAPASALENVDPPTALGTMCASALTPAQAAEVLGNLSPSAAAAALEGMSGEEVRQVLEASAMASAAAGKPIADTPLVAAMVPYMTSLDAAGAAAMIEAMPPDMAVGVMMNTPEDRAAEILARTKNSALKERVANRANLHVPSCDVVFPTEDSIGSPRSSMNEHDQPEASTSEKSTRTKRAIAGEHYALKVLAREGGGARITHGGARLVAALRASLGVNNVTKNPEPVAVRDLGDGSYEISFHPVISGDRIVVLTSGGGPNDDNAREVVVPVDAAEPVVSATVFDRQGLDDWRAGEPGILAVKMKDRFGNDVKAESALFEFEGRASGPGGVTVAKTTDQNTGGVGFEFKTTVSGIYKLSVTCVDTGETLPGMPIEAVLKAGKISHVGCTASLQTLTGATKGPGASAAAFGVAVAMAGEEITALVDARDRFGNATVWSGENATVVAHGPGHKPSDRAFDVVDVRGGRAGLRGILPRAGSYTVAVSVDDIPCACSPLVLHVYPGPCETSRAMVKGDALSGVLRGAPARLLVQTEDKFGNNCHAGGDQIDLALQGPTGTRTSAVDVIDHGDGSYGCSFVCPTAGRWIVQAVVNSRVAKESTVEVIATYGPLQASDCVLRPGPGVGERATCGAVRDVYLQALEYDSTGRGMSGQEAVSVHLLTPSGASHALAAGFAERGSRYRASVRWWEVGRHEIVATVNGEPVVGSPLVVEVDAQEMSLPMCRLSGQGLAGAVAGERAVILVEARDARGNRLFQGGASMGVAVRVGGETMRGKVLDCGDGTYEASYVVEKAGPYEVSLFLGTEATTFRVTCEPGRVDYSNCRVEGALHSRWISGKQLALVVTRNDRFGNRVPRREGLAPFHGVGTGPGKVTCEKLELGNGSCELRFMGTVAGVYNLSVCVDDQPVGVKKTEVGEETLEEIDAVDENSNPILPKSLPQATATPRAAGKPVDPKQVSGVMGSTVARANLGGLFGRTMFPLPGGQFDLTMEPGSADPAACDILVVGASKQNETWVTTAGDEILVKVLAKDRFGNDTHWNEGQNVTVEARGPEFVAFSVTGATGVKADYLARMVRAGTFELRVMVDSLAACWRAVQVVAGPTYAPRCKISMDGLKNLHTGDTCRLTLKAADQYGNLRLDGDDAIQLTLEGPGGAFARAVQVVDHADGTYALEFITPIAGRWNMSARVNGKPCVEGGVSFTVAFGTLTAEEAIVHIRRYAVGTSGANQDEEEDPTLREGVYECGTTSELVVAGAGFGENGRLMTGLEAVTVRLLQPGGTQEALPCVLSKDMTHYVAPIRWLHPGEHAVSVLLDGVRVAGTPIRARAEGIEIGLSMSALEGQGVTRCVAGEVAHIRLVARDHGGNPVLRGGAPLLVEARVPGEDPVSGQVTDNGDGTYEFSYVVDKAGPLEVALVLARKNNPTLRTLQVQCIAGPMEPSECRVDAGKLMLHWPAGDPAVVRVTRKDRFGNPTKDTGVRNRLAAEVVGPGSCDCEAVELGDGTCELRLRAGAAGSYDVSIVALAMPNPQGVEPVEVGHFTAEVAAGPTFPSACVARIALLVSDGEGGVVEESLGEPDADVTLPATVMAGDRVLVYVLPRDVAGNKTRWTGGERIAVAARGPTETPFEPLDTVGAFAATLTAAGAYSVAALVGDCSAAGWPRTLQVVAGPCDPDTSVVSGDALGNCATGKPLSLLVRATDRFGNPRSMGGDMLELTAKPVANRLGGGSGGARVDAEVTDNTDGTYTAVVTLDEATRHDIHLNVNGLSDSQSRYFLVPSLAPLSAAECVVRGVGTDGDPFLCDTSVTYVQPANPIRQMSGREAVTMVVHTPSGLAFNNPVQFQSELRRFESPVYWVEAGAHSVQVALDGELLPGCPFLVEVRDPEDESLGDETVQTSKTSKLSSSKTTTTTTTTTTTDKNGVVSKHVDKKVRAEEWAEEIYIDDDGVERTRRVRVGDDDGYGSDASKSSSKFEFGAGGLKPSTAASERAARSLSGMSAKVASQALTDMRPAAAGAVLARMDPQTAGGVVDEMSPAVAAAAICAMDASEAIATLAQCPKETRVAVLEAMTPPQLGAYLSAMTCEGAADILRELNLKWSNAGVEHMMPRKAACALSKLPEDRLLEALLGINSNQAAMILEALCEQNTEIKNGAELATTAMTVLCKRSPDKCAAHIASMVDIAMRGTERGIPNSGRAVAHLFARLPRHCQGAILTRLSAKQAAYLVSWLGSKRAAIAMAAAVAEGGGAAGNAFAAATIEALEEIGFEGEGGGAGGAAAALLAAMHDEDPDAAAGALGALDPEVAAAAVAGIPPRVAASLANGMKDPTVVAAMLEEMPADKRAAMLIKMDPEASAAAASAMDPGLAGEAMEAAQRAALLGGEDADAFTDREGEFFGLRIHGDSEDGDDGFGAGAGRRRAGAGRLSGEGDGLGAGDGYMSDAASDVSARLTAMMSKMDPFAAAQAASSMDPDVAAAVQSHLPPDRAAAMIASGGLDTADAAAMLDKLSVDAADRVMAALPPNVAERTAALVASDEIRARAVARAVVHLESSFISGPGCETVMAGTEGLVLLESANPGGGRLTRGGAHVVAVLYPLVDEFDEDGVPTTEDGKGFVDQRVNTPGSEINATTTDMATGAYEIRYTCTKSGRYHLELTTAGQSRTLVITCVPDVLDPPSCVVEPPSGKSQKWRSGETLELRVRCRDRFGNPVFPPDAATSSVSNLTTSTTETQKYRDFNRRDRNLDAEQAAHGAAMASREADEAEVLVVVADGEGPGAVEADVGADEANPTAPWSIARFRADEAGEYTLRVFAAESQRRWWGGLARDVLPGAPMSVTLAPAAPDRSKCVVKLTGAKERPGGMLVAMAGREATVAVLARDTFGNPTTFGSEFYDDNETKEDARANDATSRVRVDAVGPDDVAFTASGSSNAERKFTGAPAKSGSYVVRVTVGGRAVAGFPRNLQVVAAQTDPTQCVIRGDSLVAVGGVVVGDVTRASLVARDRFGNACLEGGDQVMVRLLGPAGATDADVVDYGDGTYGLAFTVPRAGEWRAHVAVNGAENPEPLARFTAVQGRLSAGQLCLKVAGTQGGAVNDAFALGSGLGLGRDALGGNVGFGTDGGAKSSVSPAVGVETTVYIQALDYELSGREVGGREPVCLRLLSPSGVSANVPLRPSKDRARFRATVRWPEVGEHVLVASLNGDPVVGSPTRVNVVAADVHLPVCHISGAGSGKCEAGERTRFVVEARDSRGNRLVTGGASLTLQVQVPGQEPSRGAVLDQGDGTYTASYAVDQAGPYLLVLASQSSRLALEGTCAAGPTDVSKCRVDVAELKRLTAGSRGVARVTRADRFGNVVPAGPDLLPFRVEVSGVGPAEVETVEAGDGACEVRFEARVAGRYALKVWSGHGREPVAGSPFDVVVMPGQAASSSCVARLEGTKIHGPGVTAAVAGEPLVVKMQARDRFGNPTAWKRWQTLSVAASGPQDVVFNETSSSNSDSDSRGTFVARLSRAGAYVVWCTVGGQAVVGWPRVIQVVPGVVDSDAATWRAEASTAALTSELVLSGNLSGGDVMAMHGSSRHGRTQISQTGQIYHNTVSTLREETDGLKARLAKYEEAAAVVMEAAEASGVDLKKAARNAAYRAEASGSGSRTTQSIREQGHDQRL